MRRFLIVLLGSIALVAAVACGETGPEPEVAEPMPAADRLAADAKNQFAGAWSLVRSERRDADGELLALPIEDRLGYIVYDAAGYMGVTTMRPGRTPYSEGGPTAEEALAQLGSYNSYFGRFTVNEAQGFVTHHLEGSLNPSGAGSDYKRFYTIEGNRLTLQPPADDDGSKSFITWEKLPDLPEAELTDTHRRLSGFYRIESVSRQTSDGESQPADQYDTGYIIYAPSGHMAVHLMRPDRQPYAGDGPTPEEALMAVETYGSYFGPFSVNEEEGYLVHHRIGNENPEASGTDAQRFYELTDTHLMLRPPAGTDDQGRPVQNTIRWARISD